MSAEAQVSADVEGALRTWARLRMTEVDGRVFFEFVKGAIPQIVLFKVGGLHISSIQWDVWGQHKAEAAGIASILAFELDILSSYHVDAILLGGATADQMRWLPDPDTGQARYVVDSTVVSGVIPAP